MKLSDMITMCLGNLFKRKIRTLLTVAGVVIGTCAIVIMISLGLGIKQSMDSMMEGMGDLTVIEINNYNPNPDSEPLDDSMLEKFKEIPNITAITPVMNEYQSFTIKSGKYQYQGSIMGVDMSALSAFGYEMQQGSLPGENVPEGTFLIGNEAQYYFMNPKKRNQNWGMTTDANGNPIDPPVDVMNDKMQLEININDPSKVNKKVKPIKLNCIGVMADDWNKSPAPYGIFMDISFVKEMKKEYNKVNGIKENKSVKESYQNVVVKAKDIDSVKEVENAIKEYGFSTRSMESIREPLEEQSRTIQMILGSLGAISLLVAALGIINTMTMSIYERTREIGVMKVLGCIVGNIRTMFLMEAATIGFIGGVVGIGLSYGASFVINSFAAGGGDGGGMMGMFGFGGMGGGQVSVIPPWLVFGALVFATMVGLVSGLYPANRAVKISALAAIRQE